MEHSEEEIKEFLENLASEIWIQGDNFYATQTKTGKWRVGYTNDYPLQHGGGEEMMLPYQFVELLINHE